MQTSQSGAHPAYNKWVKKALDDLNKLPENQLLDKMKKLTQLLKQEMEAAFYANTKLNEHFKNIPEFSTSMLN